MILPERVFGSPSVNWIFSGNACGPISVPDGFDDLAFHAVSRGLAGLQRDEGVDRVAFDVVRITDDRGLSHGRVPPDRALDLSGAKIVPRHDDDVVDASGDPVVAVLVAQAAVTGKNTCREIARNRCRRNAGDRHRCRASGRARAPTCRGCPGHYSLRGGYPRRRPARA